jgi:hypothetical protein
MNCRPTSFLLVLVVMAAGAGCASSGSQNGAYGAVGGFDDCANLYPPVTSGYGYPTSTYGQAYYDDGPCSVYPRLYGYYPEYVVQARSTRQVTSAEPREHRARRVTRPGDSDGSGRGSSGSSDSSSSSSSGSSGVGASVPRMDPIPVNAPAPAPVPVAIQPREH